MAHIIISFQRGTAPLSSNTFPPTSTSTWRVSDRTQQQRPRTLEGPGILPRPIPHSWSSRKTALAPLFQPGKHIGLLPNEKKKVCYSAALASTNMLPGQTSRASVKTVSKHLSNVQAGVSGGPVHFFFSKLDSPRP